MLNIFDEWAVFSVQLTTGQSDCVTAGSEMGGEKSLPGTVRAIPRSRVQVYHSSMRRDFQEWAMIGRSRQKLGTLLSQASNIEQRFALKLVLVITRIDFPTVKGLQGED